MGKKKIMLKNGDATDGDTLVRSQYSGDDDRFDTVEGILKEDPYGILKVHLKDGSTEDIYAFHPDWVIKVTPEKTLGVVDEEELQQRKERDELLDDKFKKEMDALRERFRCDWVPPFAKRDLSSKFGGHEKEITEKEKEIYEKLNDIECEIAEVIELIEES